MCVAYVCYVACMCMRFGGIPCVWCVYVVYVYAYLLQHVELCELRVAQYGKCDGAALPGVVYNRLHLAGV